MVALNSCTGRRVTQFVHKVVQSGILLFWDHVSMLMGWKTRVMLTVGGVEVRTMFVLDPCLHMRA